MSPSLRSLVLAVALCGALPGCNAYSTPAYTLPARDTECKVDGVPSSELEPVDARSDDAPPPAVLRDGAAARDRGAPAEAISLLEPWVAAGDDGTEHFARGRYVLASAYRDLGRTADASALFLAGARTANDPYRADAARAYCALAQ